MCAIIYWNTTQLRSFHFCYLLVINPFTAGAEYFWFFTLLLQHSVQLFKHVNAIMYLSVFVYYVTVRTIVLSRHGSIRDIIHSLMCMSSTPHCGFSGVSPDGNCAYVNWGSLTYNSKSVRRAIWFTWFSEPHDTTSLHDVLVYTAPGSPRRSPIQLWTGRDVA